MAKNRYCENFENILKEINDNHIHTSARLMANKKLYNNFRLTAEKFISNYVLITKTSKMTDGEISPGNSYKLNFLSENSVFSKEDMVSECLVKILSKLDLILKQPLEKQKNYCHTICNNMVNDRLRNMGSLSDISLESYVPGTENKRTYSDVIGHNYNAELLCIKKESEEKYRSVNKAKIELYKKYTREKIMAEADILNPNRFFARLGCKYINLKPRQFTEIMLSNGFERTKSALLIILAFKYSITTEEYLYLNNLPDCKKLKLETADAKIISAQLSRLCDRGNKTLDKHTSLHK